MSEYVSTAEAAEILGAKEGTLRNNASKRGAYYGNRLPVSAILPPEAVWLLTNAAKKDRLAADPEGPYRKATHVDKALAIIRVRWPQFFRQHEAKE